MSIEGPSVTTDRSATSVRRTVTVDVDQERAFTVFTEEFDSWWIRSHHIGSSDPYTAIIEPKAGGRWYERGDDGTECDWGHVVSWEPPSRVVLAWQLNADWAYDPDFLTEVEVSFIAEAPGRTRVELEHRNLDRFLDRMEEVRAAYESPGGWGGLLAAYAERVC